MKDNYPITITYERNEIVNTPGESDGEDIVGEYIEGDGENVEPEGN